MIAKRAASALAVLSLLTALGGSAYITARIGGELPGRAALWMVCPIALAAVGVYGSRLERLPTMWLPIGALWGFVILGAWSLGLFYGPAAALLSLAGVAHVASVRSEWPAVFLPLWMLAGITSVAVVVFALDRLQQDRGLIISQAPAVLFGSWLFVSAIVALA